MLNVIIQKDVSNPVVLDTSTGLLRVDMTLLIFYADGTSETAVVPVTFTQDNGTSTLKNIMKDAALAYSETLNEETDFRVVEMTAV